MESDKNQSSPQWDNRILPFDGEDHVCIGRVVRNTPKGQAYISNELRKVAVSATMISDEVWVPQDRAFYALEALRRNPMFCQIDMAGDWSVDAPVPKN